MPKYADTRLSLHYYFVYRKIIEYLAKKFLKLSLALDHYSTCASVPKRLEINSLTSNLTREKFD